MGEGRGEGSCLFWHAIRSERKAPHSDPSKKLVLQVIIVQQLAQNEFLPWPAHSQRGYEALLHPPQFLGRCLSWGHCYGGRASEGRGNPLGAAGAAGRRLAKTSDLL